MAQIANVEYFKNYCNRKLGTNYVWDSKQAINLYWTTYAIRKVYNDIHQPKATCKHPISIRFNLSESAGLIVVDTSFIHTVIDYLYNFKAACNSTAACQGTACYCVSDDCVCSTKTGSKCTCVCCLSNFRLHMWC